MCGIAGLLTDEASADVEVARRMVRAQAHRGPDVLAAISADAHVAVGHARLSIVDLSEAGNQPFMANGNVLVYNGEIYNHQALRPELEGKGAVFHGTSDTATLMEALRLLGVEATLARIRGMFAFAYYETSSRSLYLCRDRLGIKPLHYLQRGGTLYFSSEVKGLAAAVSLSVDAVRALFAIASVADDSLDRTAFRGVRQVAPGTFLVCRPKRTPKAHRYYAPIDDFDESHYRELAATPRADVVRQLAEKLEASVVSMLMSDARLGAFVSGGIDSSVIAAFARRHTTDLPLFTSNVVGPDSEVADARLLASSIGAPLHESAFTPDDFLEHWARATWHYEYPIVRHMNAVPFSVVAGLARENSVKVVLTGEGADELFLGYPKLLTRRFDGIARSPVDTLLSLYGQVPGLREHLWPNPADQPDGFVNLLVQDYQRQRLREHAMPKLEFLGKAAAGEHYLTLQMLQESLHSLLHRNDRMGMSNSIEARFPFLDEDIIRFGINLPVKFKIHWSKRFHNYKHPFLEDKSLLRTMARELLPQPLVSKRKNGFPLPGYRALRIAPTFFERGFVEDALSLSRATFEYVTQHISPMFVARLAAMDLHGRLFEHGVSVANATEHVRKHVSLAA
jgi:asparagine synthase (glutamine-hydrolysing)